MVDTSSNLENVYIYYANLSPYYIFSCIFTLLALLSTWWFRNVKELKDMEEEKNTDSEQKPHQMRTNRLEKKSDRTSREVKQDSSEMEENYDTSCDLDEVQQVANRLAAENLAHDHNILRRIKAARQSAIEQRLAAGLSEDQLKKEKETQASQLAAIFNLLKQQEDHFQIKSMEELEQQMKLYRA